MIRPFIKLSEDTIQFDNGNIVTFIGTNDTFIAGELVSVQVWMDYLLSDQYLIDNNLEPR